MGFFLTSCGRASHVVEIRYRLGERDFAGADLSGAFLLWAGLHGAELTGASLYGADLTGAIVTDEQLAQVKSP